MYIPISMQLLISHRENRCRMSSSSYSFSGILNLGSPRGVFRDLLIYQSMSALLHYKECVTSWRLVVECLLPSMAASGELCIFSSFISSNSSVQISDRTCHRLVQTSDPCWTLLVGYFFAFHGNFQVHSL